MLYVTIDRPVGIIVCLQSKSPAFSYRLLAQRAHGIEMIYTGKLRQG